VHVPFFKRRAIIFYRDANLRMISKRLAIDHAKTKCSAYVGAAMLCRESLGNVSAGNRTLHKKREECGPQNRSHSKDVPLAVLESDPSGTIAWPPREEDAHE
jgi:hypothetical protein